MVTEFEESPEFLYWHAQMQLDSRSLSDTLRAMLKTRGREFAIEPEDGDILTWYWQARQELNAATSRAYRKIQKRWTRIGDLL